MHSVKAIKLMQTMKGGGKHGLTCKDRRSYNVQSVEKHSGNRFTWSKQLWIKLEVCWVEDELSKKMRCRWDVSPWSWVNVISIFLCAEIHLFYGKKRLIKLESIVKIWTRFSFPKILWKYINFIRLACDSSRFFVVGVEWQVFQFLKSQILHFLQL